MFEMPHFFLKLAVQQSFEILSISEDIYRDFQDCQFPDQCPNPASINDNHQPRILLCEIAWIPAFAE